MTKNAPDLLSAPFIALDESMHARKIAVVEDNKINSRLFVDLLELNSIVAYPILDGDVAFDVIMDIKPDMVIMDIQLQKISGIDIIKRLKSVRADLPIIAVTAFASQQDERKIMAAGCDAYMSKPISIEHFMKLVNKYLNNQ